MTITRVEAALPRPYVAQTSAQPAVGATNYRSAAAASKSPASAATTPTRQSQLAFVTAILAAAKSGGILPGLTRVAAEVEEALELDRDEQSGSDEMARRFAVAASHFDIIFKSFPRLRAELGRYSQHLGDLATEQSRLVSKLARLAVDHPKMAGVARWLIGSDKQLEDATMVLLSYRTARADLVALGQLFTKVHDAIQSGGKAKRTGCGCCGDTFDREDSYPNRSLEDYGLSRQNWGTYVSLARN